MINAFFSYFKGIFFRVDFHKRKKNDKLTTENKTNKIRLDQILNTQNNGMAWSKLI